jgi:hypothetical protein
MVSPAACMVKRMFKDLRRQHSTFFTPWNTSCNSTGELQHPASDFEHLTFNIQHSTFNIQHSTFNIQHRTSNGPARQAFLIHHAVCEDPATFNPNSEVGRDGALRRPRVVPGAELSGSSENPCTIGSARSTRAGTAQRAVPTTLWGRFRHAKEQEGLE